MVSTDTREAAVAEDKLFGHTVSDPDDSLDQMVEAASRPSLSDLFQQAKDAGHIQAVQEYGFTKP